MRLENLTSPEVQLCELEPLVDAAEFRRLLSMTPRSFRRQRSAGTIPPPDLVIGTARRWRAETVKRLIEKGSPLTTGR